jgi:hypothetical protein
VRLNTPAMIDDLNGAISDQQGDQCDGGRKSMQSLIDQSAIEQILQQLGAFVIGNQDAHKRPDVEMARAGIEGAIFSMLDAPAQPPQRTKTSRFSDTLIHAHGPQSRNFRTVPTGICSVSISACFRRSSASLTVQPSGITRKTELSACRRGTAANQSSNFPRGGSSVLTWTTCIPASMKGTELQRHGFRNPYCTGEAITHLE